MPKDKKIAILMLCHILPNQINDFIDRLDDGHFEEVILATNPTVDGETTSMYLAKLLQKYNVKVTRLAYGLQIGGNLDYVDPLTLSKALEGRHKI